MRKQYLYLGFIFCALVVLVGCNTSIIGKKMILPAQIITEQNNNYKIVVYYNARGCTSCRLSELGAWNLLLKKVKTQSLPIDFVFILKSEKTDTEINERISDARFTHEIIFDPLGEFEVNNTLPSDDTEHVFLLDPKMNIISIVNPIYYTDVWEKFCLLATQKED